LIKKLSIFLSVTADDWTIAKSEVDDFIKFQGAWNSIHDQRMKQLKDEKKATIDYIGQFPLLKSAEGYYAVSIRF
jgi:hypothetical protein